MTAFSSPEILADHYQKEHDDTAANEETASQDSSLQAMSEFQARREIIELQSALAVSIISLTPLYPLMFIIRL